MHMQMLNQYDEDEPIIDLTVNIWINKTATS